MRALVLAAGLGTRLRPLTDVRAKPAIPVAGQPMIRRILAWLAGHGVADVVINLHYLPQTLTAAVGDGSDLAVRVRYSWEQPEVLGSAGGPRHALPLMDDDPFLIVNGDTLTDLDVERLAAAHRASGALVTLAAVPNREPHRYGGLLLNREGHVLGVARAGSADANRSHHFVGAQMTSAETFRNLPDGQPLASIGGVYDQLMSSRPGSVRAFVTDARFWDIGTVADYVKTSADYSATDARNARAPSAPHAVTGGARLEIGAGAVIQDSILWDDVSIGEGCVLRDCIVTDGVRLPDGMRCERAILIASNDARPRLYPLDRTHG